MLTTREFDGQFQQAITGQLGGIYIKDTFYHTGTFGMIVALEDTVFANLDSPSMLGDKAGLTLPKGMTLYGNYTLIKLTSGKIIAYSLEQILSTPVKTFSNLNTLVATKTGKENVNVTWKKAVLPFDVKVEIQTNFDRNGFKQSNVTILNSTAATTAGSYAIVCPVGTILAQVRARFFTENVSLPWVTSKEVDVSSE